jgi:hypothetical protein
MFKHIGHTEEVDHFYIRDTGGFDGVNYGLTYTGFNLFHNNCNNAGDIDQGPGMIMVK